MRNDFRHVETTYIEMDSEHNWQTEWEYAEPTPLSKTRKNCNETRRTEPSRVFIIIRGAL